MVSIVVHFFDLLSDAGNQKYLIQKDNVSRDDFNTAWTIDILIKSSLAIVLFACTHIISSYFEEPRLILAIQIMSLVLPINALKNPALAQLARDFNYKKLAYLQVIQKLFSFLIVIFVVLLVDASYWAIIAGDITASLTFTLGSYFIIHFIPRWSLKNIHAQWRFSQWLLLRSIFGFFRAQLDITFVSRLFGSSQVGGYHLTRELALLPAVNILIPALEPLLSAIAKSKGTAKSLAYRVRLSLFCLALVIIPISVFIWFFYYEIVAAVLGDQWITYEILLKYFSLIFLTYPMFAMLSNTLIAVGKVRKLFLFDLSTTVALFILLFSVKNFSIEAFTLIRCYASIIFTIPLLYLVNRLTCFLWGRFLYLTIPIIIGAVLAALISQYISKLIDIKMIFKLGMICISYFSIYLLLIFISFKTIL